MRRVLAPKWWLVHVLVVVAVLVMLRLGLWQWHRANAANGGIQNYAYAFQWPVFAAFAIFLWGKTLYEEVRRGGPKADPDKPVVPLTPEADIRYASGYRVGLTTEAVSVDADDDPDVAAWNARLAALNAAHTAAHAGGGARDQSGRR
ncbi:MAG TPA: hypothetical protein VFT62_06785 [Mycobacteriales bacterium]|nr:hypothetical protein [Mycobacteriales bacterium]